MRWNSITMIMAIPRNPSSRGIRPSIFFPSSVLSIVVNVSEIRRWDKDEQSHSFQAQYGTRLDYSWHNADPGAAIAVYHINKAGAVRKDQRLKTRLHIQGSG